MVGEAREADGDAGPLDGVTVLDASRVLAAPFCGMQLGDLGADVVKVERPGTGDQTRGFRPPTYGDSDESAYYLSINRNKRSVELNLASEDGRDLFRELAAEADVLLENFRVGKLEAWDLGYESLSAANPALVHAHVTGYGEWGPRAEDPAYDIMMQAEGGMMSITGQADGPPVRVGVAVADLAAGMYTTQAVLAALFAREFRDAGGQKIDVSLYDGQVAWMSYMASQYFATGEAPGRMGSRHPNIAPYQAFETADDYLVVAVSSENFWPRFCRALDRPDLVEDPRFATNEARVRNREDLDEILAAEFADRETETAAERLAEHGVPASPVRDIAEVFESDQVAARGMRRAVDHPTAGEVEMPASPMHFSGTPTSIRRHPPLLGEHTASVLAELGYSAEEVARLQEAGVLGASDGR